jgi:hypothetical protein
MTAAMVDVSLFICAKMIIFFSFAKYEPNVLHNTMYHLYSKDAIQNIIQNELICPVVR